MDCREEYRKKLISADEAAGLVKSGDWVDFGWCATTADAFDRALAKRTDELHDVNLRGAVLLKPLAVMAREDAGEHFTWNSWHFTGIERQYNKRGCGFLSPLRYSELPRYYRENTERLDIAVFQASPMDEYGYFSFGPSPSAMRAVCDRADKVIVEVNQNVPRCYGGYDAEINIRDVDYVIEGDNPPLPELPAGGPASEVDKTVARMIVQEIPDGACLQLGIGSMPNAVGSLIAESDLKDLGVHTEMYVDAFVDLTKAGKINGRKKNIDCGRQTFAFAAGTKKLYDFINDNPEIMCAPVDYVNAVETIGKIDNFMSINNAINIDLFGQVNAETAGIRQISGPGGQLDFVMGAYRSRGGKSFICMSATHPKKDGTVESRIVPTLPAGTVVTDSRPCIQYLVTEYGMVNLKGTSAWQRAEKIISVAAPDFRDQLISDAEKMGIWRRSNRR